MVLGPWSVWIGLSNPLLHLEKTHLCLERSAFTQNFVVGSVVGKDFILL